MEETQSDETDLDKVLMKLGRTANGLKADGKSAAWKLAPASALKARTPAANRWLGAALQLGNLHAVSRKVAAWTRAPDVILSKKLALTPNPKAHFLTVRLTVFRLRPVLLRLRRRDREARRDRASLGR